MALQLFTKRGYDATSIEDIREAAGFKSKASLYSHFKSKEAISESLKCAILEQIRDEVFSSCQSALPEPSSQFITFLQTYIEWAFTHRERFVFRIIRAQEERMEKGQYDWQRDMQQNAAANPFGDIYTLFCEIITQLPRKDYPLRDISIAALFHMMIGAITRAVIDRDSFTAIPDREHYDWSVQIQQTVEVCLGILFKKPIRFQALPSEPLTGPAD